MIKHTNRHPGGGQRALTGGEEEELEIGEPSNEKRGETAEMEGVEIEGKVEEDANDRENEEKSCKSLSDFVANAVAIPQTDPY